MLKAIIIDDEVAARKSLEKIIQLYIPAEVTVEGIADNLKTGIQLIHKTKPDVVFLDIEMPMQSGLELFDYVEVNFDVVVISAYKDYAIDALRNGATDYLLKPVNVTELKQAIERITQSRNSLSHAKAETTKPTDSGKLLLPCAKGFLILPYNEIMAIEADGNQSVVYKSNGEKILINKGLGSFEMSLPNMHFFRCHRSAIINTQYVTEINRDKSTVTLNHNTHLPLAVNNTKPLIDKLKAILDVEFN
jgi:two-component system, LytTR family, response regulator